MNLTSLSSYASTALRTASSTFKGLAEAAVQQQTDAPAAGSSAAGSSATDSSAARNAATGGSAAAKAEAKAVEPDKRTGLDVVDTDQSPATAEVKGRRLGTSLDSYA